jgi:hypothetical protein
MKWMEEDGRRFWEILTYNGNSSTPIPFIPPRSTNSQTSLNVAGIFFLGFLRVAAEKKKIVDRQHESDMP